MSDRTTIRLYPVRTGYVDDGKFPGALHYVDEHLADRVHSRGGSQPNRHVIHRALQTLLAFEMSKYSNVVPSKYSYFCRLFPGDIVYPDEHANSSICNTITLPPCSFGSLCRVSCKPCVVASTGSPGLQSRLHHRLLWGNGLQSMDDIRSQHIWYWQVDRATFLNLPSTDGMPLADLIIIAGCSEIFAGRLTCPSMQTGSTTTRAELTMGQACSTNASNSRQENTQSTVHRLHRS